MGNITILIVEDEAIVAEDLSRKVSQLGYTVAGTAMSGEEAIVLSRQLQPGLVLMDIRLAGAMDGIEAARIIHGEYNLPILFLTAHSDTNTIERARQVGALGYVLKPFDERDLRIQIEMALYKHGAELRLLRSEARLVAINKVLQAAFSSQSEEELGRECLTIAEELTQSQFGFICDFDGCGIQNIAVSNPGWDACHTLRPTGHCLTPLGRFKVHGIYGRVITEGTSLLTNDPMHHPDSIGLPEQHPPLTSFLGVPLKRDGVVVGMIAVGNRAQGYTEVEIEAVEALAPSIVAAFLRKRTEVELQRSSDELKTTNTELVSSRQQTLQMMHDAVAAMKKAEEASIELKREIMEREKAERALQTLNEELERRVERRTLELQETHKKYLHAEKLSAIGKLSASFAHEFNNPLQGILAVLNGFNRRVVLDQDDKSLLDEAIEECHRLKDLILNLQEFNTPSTGRKDLVNLHKMLDSVLLLNKSDFFKRDITLTLDYAPHLPQIEAIADQIKQVFLNLLANAADACSPGGGLITIRTWQEDEEKVAVSFKDTGVGIRPEDMDLIFQPFFTTKAEVKGIGLGLSVSYGIVKHHQGELRVASEPNCGATFTVILPVKGSDTII